MAAQVCSGLIPCVGFEAVPESSVLVLIESQRFQDSFFTAVFKVIMPPGEIQWPCVLVYELFGSLEDLVHSLSSHGVIYHIVLSLRGGIILAQDNSGVCQSSSASVPATIKHKPTAAFTLSFSFRMKYEKATVKRMLSLSMGTTTLAGPVWSAR